MPEYSVEDLIRQEADAAGVPAELALAVAEQESGFNPTAKSPKGALGTMQLMPNTAKIYQMDPNDPVQNIRGGVLHLRSLLDSHKGDLNKVLAAYNSGRTENLPAETQAYVPGVLGRMPKFNQQKVGQAVGAPPPKPPVAAAAPPPYVDEGASGTHSILSSMVSGLDPRTPEGRRNLAGAAGSAGLAYATSGMSTVPGILAAGARIGAPIVGAMMGGATAEAGEQAVGNAPPSLSRVGTAAAEQGTAEAIGGALMWPLKAVGRRLVAPAVGASVRTAITDTIDSASSSIASRKKQISATVAGVKAGTEAQVEKLGQRLSGVPGGPPPAAVGRQVNKVVQGPAKSVLEQTGDSVEEAALSGPMVSLKGVRDKIDQVGKQMQRPGGEPPSVGGGGAWGDPSAYITKDQRQLMKPEDLKLLAQVEDTHPVKGILGELQNLGDEIPFAEAHRIKRLLDETVNWESPARKIVQQATKGVRQELRAAMSEAGHAPYEEATKAYQELVPLFRKGIAPKLKKQIAENPELVVNTIKPNQPTQVQMLKDLLLTQAEKGGGGPEGQAAWNALRSEWTFRNVVKGNVQDLGKRLSKLPDDFRGVFYDDQVGKEVLDNLQQISSAYDDAIRTGKIAIDSTKRAGTQAIEGKEAVIEGAKKTAREFSGSSLGGVHKFESVATDAIRAAILTPTSAWQNVALLRLMVHGPKVPELIQYAAYSKGGTQKLVKVLTSRAPGMALADLIRTPGLIDFLNDKGEPGSAPPPSQPVRAQGPAPARPQLGGPPPAVSRQ
jgi:hypothetical protein